MRLLNEPVLWRVALVGGSVVEVWADAAEDLSGPDDDRDYLFVNLMEIAPDQRSMFEIVGEIATHQERVVVAVARFPRASVVSVFN